ncbi:chaperone modulator CbpM [Nitrosospira sp. NRS527]|uniref:chaperone modulator CbpM n=1 Tax=Nitrosospira sp. NRS527 TaxID=155925 RepID=UPI001AFA8E1C|nr:chaperone modulator CbpM [Nitrosospira sp. NRS527]BCT68068.1 Chaperone modulatory protein CbpM [Nitrosospira sp. NRS527]
MMDENRGPEIRSGRPPGTQTELNAIVIDEQNALTLSELSRACAVQTGYIIELVDEGLLTPESAEEHEPQRWRFTGIQMRRARVALRLQHDLGVNLAGIALALQLLDEVEMLRTRLNAIDAAMSSDDVNSR